MVDSDGILLGIVTIDDVLDVAQEEVTEDFHKLAAIAPLTDFDKLVSKRLEMGEKLR